MATVNDCRTERGTAAALDLLTHSLTYGGIPYPCESPPFISSPLFKLGPAVKAEVILKNSWFTNRLDVSASVALVTRFHVPFIGTYRSLVKETR